MVRACSVPGCTRAAHARGRCRPHDLRVRKYGSALGGRAMRGAHIEWLNDNVNHDREECLIWPFSAKQDGYGSVRVDGKTMMASRYMCILAHGAPPSDHHEAAHSCGNGHLGCTNPKHLRWATRRENIQDAIRHGVFPQGERKTGQAKLTDETVRRIREMRAKGHTYREISNKFNVDPSNACKIVKRKMWGHVQ